MIIASLTKFRPGRDDQVGVGSVIVTSDAEGGMVDAHDRLPAVFSSEDAAALWMDNSLPPTQAEQLVRSVSLPSEAFERFEVSKEVTGWQKWPPPRRTTQ